MVSYLLSAEDCRAAPFACSATMPLRLLACCLLLGFGLGAHAQDLYSGIAEVTDQGEAQRREALSRALFNVLQKLSGLRELPAGPQLNAELARAPDLVVSFQYQQLPDLLAGPAAPEQTILLASFLPSAVDASMGRLQLPRWRPRRPPVVLWALLNDGSGPQIKPFEYQYAWDHLEAVLARRGQPVAWPDLSEELKQLLDPESLWNGDNPDPFAQLAGDDVLAVLRATREGAVWTVEWSYQEPLVGDGNEPAMDKTGQERAGLVFADQLSSRRGQPGQAEADTWQSEGTDLLVALGAGAHRLVDRIAEANTLGAAGQGQWREELRVSGLQGASDYAQLLGYLEQLTLVDDLAVRGLSEQGIQITLTLNAEPRYLQASLRADRVLEQLADSPGEYQFLSQGGN